MLTRHSSFAIPVLTVVLAASFIIAGIPSLNAADMSLGYGGDGVWPQTATANSQRWFRARVTWDAAINDDGVSNERIDGLYLTNGVSFHNTVAAPSGTTYRDELTAAKGLWTQAHVPSHSATSG